MPLPAGLAPLFYRVPPTGKGLASHAGVRHEDGRSAIHEMARQILRKAQALYREIGKELADVPLTGGGSDGNFTAALGIPTLDGLGADGKGAHAAYEQIYYSSLVPRTYLCTRLLETLE